jgi:Tol biopolymer transport system component
MTMHDVKQELRSLADELGRSTIDIERVRGKAHKRARRSRLSAGVVAGAVVIASGAFLVRAFVGDGTLPGSGLPGVTNGAISFTVADPNTRDARLIGIVAAGAPTVEIEGVADWRTGGWSPDGTQLVVSRLDGDSLVESSLWVADADGSTAQRLTSDPGYDNAGQFSPDGRKILFVRMSGDDSPALMVIDADGGSLQQIAGADEEVIFEAVWSPDGTQVITMGHSGEEGDPNWLAVIDADGSDRRILYQGPYNMPMWSPDGRHILIASRGRMLLIPLDGSEPMSLGDGLDHQGLSRIAWSPDGSTILYTRPIDHVLGEELWIMDANGGKARMVAEGLQWRDPAPTWSPDGRAIAFVKAGDIWTIELATNELTRITDTETYESSPAWTVARR